MPKLGADVQLEARRVAADMLTNTDRDDVASYLDARTSAEFAEAVYAEVRAIGTRLDPDTPGRQ